MQLSQHVTQVRDQLTAAAALGDDATRRVAEGLAVAAEPAMRLAVLGAVTAAADEITAALLDSPGAPAVAVRLDGDEVQIEVRTAEVVEPVPAEDTDASARISLRLSDSLKSDIEAAARAESVSVNTWLVRAAGRALASSPRPGPGWEGRGGWDGRGNNPYRITGWING
ncbi:MAG: toxin-antitoxin system HicB family antitoxin [Jatrophihabitantaceae bacterium]